jgi:transposase
LLFRSAIYEHQREKKEKMIDTVEIDESYFGARRIRGRPGKLKRGRGTNKQSVFGVFVRDGSVYTEIIPDYSKKTLQDVIKGKIDVHSVIMSDKWPGYDGLVDVGFDKHLRINHSKHFSENGCHINGIESFWSFTKRRLAKFNGVKRNFVLHLKECEWRWGKTHEYLFKELCSIFFNS